MASKKQPIVLAAGGTGGHIFPAEALAEELIKRGERVVLITDKRFTQFKSGALAGVEQHFIRAGGFSGSPFKKIIGAAGLLMGIAQARGALKKLQAAAVIGFGGYPSFPTVFAASGLGIPTLIHEQNSVLGRANRLLAARAGCIATSFPETMMVAEKDRAKAVFTGNPVRAAVRALKDLPYAPIAEEGKVQILATGGSQGASIFAQVVPEAIALLPAALRARLRIDQQCRPQDFEPLRARYTALGVSADIATFFADIPARLAVCHLAIARAGASTISEFATAGRPAILVPLPTAMDNHQYYNAEAFEDAGGGWVMAQDGFTPESLSARLEAFLTAPDTLARAAENARKISSADAAEKLAALVLSVASGQWPVVRKTASLTTDHSSPTTGEAA